MIAHDSLASPKANRTHVFTLRCDRSSQRERRHVIDRRIEKDKSNGGTRR